jgi:hypothetical protein
VHLGSLSNHGLTVALVAVLVLAVLIVAARVRQARASDGRDDPIRRLADGLEVDGRPAFDWVVQWSLGAEDPVASAWRVSVDGPSMVRVLAHARRYDAIVAALDVLGPIAVPVTAHWLDERLQLRVAAALLRKVRARVATGDVGHAASGVAWAAATPMLRSTREVLRRALADAVRRVHPTPPRLDELVRERMQ